MFEINTVVSQMTLESAMESALAPITEIMLDAEMVQPLYGNHEEVNLPPSSYMATSVGRYHHRYIELSCWLHNLYTLCILCYFFLFDSNLEQKRVYSICPCESLHET
jgi:hypothetical protein